MQFKKDKQGKITSVKWLNKKGLYVEITDSTECILLCDIFIAFGGDGYPMELFCEKVKDFQNKITTNSFATYLKHLKKIPSDTYRVAEVTDESLNISTINGTIETLNNGGSTNGAAIME